MNKCVIFTISIRTELTIVVAITFVKYVKYQLNE